MKYIISTIRVLFLTLFLFLILKGKMILWHPLFAISLIVALLFGRVYCGYVCPMNTLMIPLEWISKKLKLQTEDTPKWLASGKFAWFALAVTTAITLIDRRFLKLNLPILIIWLATSLIVTLRYKPSVFHNLICPYGVLQRVFGKHAIFSKKVKEEACIGCKLCEKTCPSEAIVVSTESKKAKISTVLCLQCSNCQEVCPKDAIHYSKQK